MHDPLSSADLAFDELRQRQESGYDVGSVAAELARTSSKDTARLEALYEAMLGSPRQPDWPYAEPEALDDILAAMPALADPGTEAARRNLIFREDGFWLFGLGHRYGDMRRMMRQYGMTANEVFPNGTWQINRAPGYSTDVVFRTPTAETFNPLQPQSNGAATCLNLTP